MNIAFLIMKMGSGGAERSVSALSTGLSEKHKVTVFVINGDSSFYPFGDKVNVVYLRLPELPTGKSFKRVLTVIKRALSIRKAVKAESSDVLVGMSHIMSAYAVFCTAFTKILSVGTERSNPFKFNSGRLITLLRKCSSVLCDGFVCQTKKASSFFPSSVQKKCAVIPNAVFNPHVFETTVPTVREKNITALGRLEPYKGFDILLTAFSKIHQKYPDYTLTVFGEGKELQNLIQLAEKLGVSDFVRFPGTDENAVSKIARSAVFILSSRFEGMPNALIEAMACGVPCVSTDCDMGPCELIDNGVSGMLVSVDDADALSLAVSSILSDSALSEKLSSNALNIRSTHSIDAVCFEWASYFDSLKS